MNFQSIEFLVFFVLVIAIYWNLRLRGQNYFLIAASLFFYGFIHPWFLLPFLATTMIDYLVARRLESAVSHRRYLVTLSVCSNLGLLAVFKYFNFFVENADVLLDAAHLHLPLPALRIALPAGISFYTFQSIGYVVDVYRGHVRACRRLRDYALFVAFFPQLVAGPIQRSGDLLPQIQQPRTLSPETAFRGLYLLLWGFFKKLVIADNVAMIANKVFSLQVPSFPILWAGVFAFAIQIYADFSAYTDIARGSAHLLGFELSRNFHHPYLADSPADFWRRWHISLSTWIRDYIYIPLGGSRVSHAREIVNLLIVFFLTGLWHGASWNFVIWGLYYAVLTMAYRLAAFWAPDHGKAIRGAPLFRVLLMFCWTNIGWLIFRERDIDLLWRDLRLSPLAAPAGDWLAGRYLFGLAGVYAIPLALHALWDCLPRPEPAWTAKRQPWISMGSTILATAMFFCILLLRSDLTRDFIYFQF
jgi:D-alanyl-lipoteichoic acid acyltransferase DltB (MBOAT superfamily)